MVDDFAEMIPAERGKVPGIKPERGDLILAGALVVQTVMEAGGFDAMEVTEAGLREGVFLGQLLRHRDPPLFNNVRRASVRNLAAEYDQDSAHTNHVAELALTMWDALGSGDPVERELLWSAAMLHDIGDVDRLRRPPQALALPDPQRRPAGLLPARDRADRPDGPLPPQGQPDGWGSSRRWVATATTRCWRAARPCCGWPSSSSARAIRRSTACA